MDEQQITEPRAKRKYKQRAIKTEGEKAITELQVRHRYIVKEILKALKGKQCGEGTTARLHYLEKLQELTIGYTKAMTALGALPKNAHNQSRTEFKFKSVVGHGGQIQTLPVTEEQLKTIEKREAKEIELPYVPEDEAIREQLEREFGSSAVCQPQKEEPQCQPSRVLRA